MDQGNASISEGDNLSYSGPVEHQFICPYCGEEISMILDSSVRRQSYVEDCEVCCRPIEISYTIEGGELASSAAKPLE